MRARLKATGCCKERRSLRDQDDGLRTGPAAILLCAGLRVG
jgi:hypothetical protein